jgi:hypothetical protein
MALNRSNKYPGRFLPTTTARPQGAFKNRTTPTAQDGSYLEADWANDWDGFFARILNRAGITPNGNVDDGSSSQLYDALVSLLLQKTNNLADLQSASTARTNLGLGTAATYTASGDGTTLPTAGSFSLGVTGAFKLPTGIIVQWDTGATASGGFTKSFPTPFPNQCLALIPAIYSGLGASYSVVANTSNRLQANINVVNSNGNGVSGITVGYIATGF